MAPISVLNFAMAVSMTSALPGGAAPGLGSSNHRLGPSRPLWWLYGLQAAVRRHVVEVLHALGSSWAEVGDGYPAADSPSCLDSMTIWIACDLDQIGQPVAG
jgi:hypothetical protein